MFFNYAVGETLESPLDSKEIQPVHPKGNQSWIFIGRTGVEAETPRLWSPDAKNWLIWKDIDVGKDWRQEEKGTIEDEMVEWHHQLNGRMASPTQWTWLWVNSGSWRWIGRPGILQSMELQRASHSWVPELNWTDAEESSLLIPTPSLNYLFLVYPHSLPFRVLNMLEKWEFIHIASDQWLSREHGPHLTFIFTFHDDREVRSPYTKFWVSDLYMVGRYSISLKKKRRGHNYFSYTLLMVTEVIQLKDTCSLEGKLWQT